MRYRLSGAAVACCLVLAGCSSSADEDAASATAETSTPTAETTTTPLATTTVAPSTTEVTDPSPTDIEIAAGDFVFDAVVAGPADGEPVFLLHGFPQTNYEWRFQITALSEAGYRVIAPNQRGYSAGARPLKVDDYALDVIASDVIAMADALDVERFHLVGHDFGGAAGWQAAAAYPERVASFTSISTPHPTALFASIDDPASDQAARSSYFDVFVQPDAADLFIENDAALLRGMYGSIGLSEDEIEGQLEVLGSREAIDAALNWYRAGGLGDTIGPSTVPTMYIWSDADDALGPDPAAATGDYVTGDYRYEVLDGIDHWVPERAPDAVNALLLDFLSDQDAL